MNKHLLSNVSFLKNKGYLKLADSLHFKKYILVTVVTSTSIATDSIKLLYSIFSMTCKMQKQTAFNRWFLNIWLRFFPSKLEIQTLPTQNLNCYLLTVVKLHILADVPCRLHGTYVGITVTLPKLNSTC